MFDLNGKYNIGSNLGRVEHRMVLVMKEVSVMVRRKTYARTVSSYLLISLDQNNSLGILALFFFSAFRKTC